MSSNKYHDLRALNLDRVEILSESNWNGGKYIAQDPQEAIATFPKVVFEPTVKAGHTDGQDDEKPGRHVPGSPPSGYFSKIYEEAFLRARSKSLSTTRNKSANDQKLFTKSERRRSR